MDVIRYVNTNSVGGNGTTNELSGVNAAYISLSAWNSAEQTNLVTDGDEHYCYVSGGQDTVASSTSLAGWTTGASNRLIILANPDTVDGKNRTGVFSENYHYLEVGSSAFNAINIGDSYIEFRDMQFRHSVTDVARTYAPIIAFTGDVPAATSAFKIQRCIFHDNSTSEGSRGLFISNVNVTLDIESCIFEWSNVTNHDAIRINTCTAIGVYNNTIEGGFGGIRTGSGAAGTLSISNSAIFNGSSYDVFDQGSIISLMTNCATGNGAGSNPVTIANATAWNINFIYYVNGDYRLKPASTLRNTGDSGTLITNDVRNRTYNSNDIGALAFYGRTQRLLTKVG